MPTSEAPQHFTDDLARFNAALEPYVFEVDGEKFISPDAPEALTRPYGSLLSMGYANGWIQ